MGNWASPSPWVNRAEEVYERWFEAGAHRYLLRIESSNPDLYQSYHPSDKLHDYARRLTS